MGTALTDHRPYKACFVAYCCEPGRGSEWGLGWSYVQEISRTQPVWVIVHSDCRAGLDQYLAEKHTGHPVHAIYVDGPRGTRRMRKSCYSLFNLHYYLWQFSAARALRRLHKQVGLDLVQHVSLCRWWMPSAVATLAGKGVGVIFGPVGGGEVLPGKFRDRSPLVGKIGDALRFIGRTVCRRDPLLTRCVRRADLLLAAIPSAQAWLKRYGNPNVELDCGATCSSQDVIDAAVRARHNRLPDRPFTFGSCGGLSYFRGVDLAIRAFAKADIANSRYVHACDGPTRPALEQLARDLGVADRVVFLGDMPHAQCVTAMAEADAVVHTVLRDSQGVLPDVLCAGVPVITLNHLTPAMLVTPQCGHLLAINDATGPDDIVNELAGVMRQWHADPALLAEKGRAAADRGRLFHPEARGVALRATHDRVLRGVRQRAESRSNAGLSGPLSRVLTGEG